MARLAILLLALAWAPSAALAQADADARMRAAGFVPMHEQVRNAQPRNFVSCAQWGQIAAGYAHERNLGHSEASRVAGLTRDPAADQAVLATARVIIRALYAQPAITPAEAYGMARDACGWPGVQPPSRTR